MNAIVHDVDDEILGTCTNIEKRRAAYGICLECEYEPTSAEELEGITCKNTKNCVDGKLYKFRNRSKYLKWQKGL